MTNTAPVGGHVGVTEIGELLGVSRQRANKLVARPEFPAPVAQTRAGRVWERAAVVAWEKGWDRDNVGGRPPRSAAAQQQK
ncbi:helix-turn-helix transcriptional regulator [Streptomyces sp. NPDC088555]|uniref:helix-turn-helix transcriptional regulator n=1 Tax=Streptomyces sp. NPDC088555 TaxID=3365866 RepID=UPI003826B513